MERITRTGGFGSETTSASTSVAFAEWDLPTVGVAGSAAGPVTAPPPLTLLPPFTVTCPTPTRPVDASLRALAEVFLHDHLALGRSASPHTLRAYRQTLDLFIAFLEGDNTRRGSHLDAREVPPHKVVEFLDSLEGSRGNRAATRNARLGALRSFARFLQFREPAAAEAFTAVLSIQHRPIRNPPPAILEPSQFQIFLQTLPVQSAAGCRDACLFQLLYDSGARISEVLALRWSDVVLDGPHPSVRFQCESHRERTCPLDSDTAERLRQLRVRTSRCPEGPIFLNALGQPLSRDGAAYILRARYRAARLAAPSLPELRIHPHTLRFSRTTDLRRRGVAPSDIRRHLGISRIPRQSRPEVAPRFGGHLGGPSTIAWVTRETASREEVRSQPRQTDRTPEWLPEGECPTVRE